MILGSCDILDIQSSEYIFRVVCSVKKFDQNGLST